MADPIDYAALAAQARQSNTGVDYSALAEQARQNSDSHIQPTQYPKPAAPKPGLFGTQNPIDRFAGGVADTIGGFTPSPIEKGKQAYRDFTQGHYADAALHAGEAAIPIPGMNLDTVKSAVDQGKKAVQSWQQGEHSQAVGHGVAAALPVVGPAAANAADLAGGELPKFDQYGGMQDPGKEPDIARGLGQASAPVIADGLIRGVGTALKRPILQQSPDARAAVIDLERNGIPVSAAAKTDNLFIKNAQKTVDSSPLGAIINAKAGRDAAAGLTDYSNQLMDQAHPSPTVPVQAGQDIRDALTVKAEGHEADANASYSRVADAESDPANLRSVETGTREVPGLASSILDEHGQSIQSPMRTVPVTEKIALPVSVGGLKEKLQPIYESMQWMPAPDRNSSPGYTAIEKILNGPDYIPASQAEKGLSGLKTMARDSEGASAGIGKFIVPKLQQMIDSAVAEAGPNTLQALQDARAHAARGFETKEVLDSLSKMKQEPVATFNQLTQQKDGGISLIRRVQQQAPAELPKIGRAYLEDLFGRATAVEGKFTGADGIYTNWQKLGLETKKVLFPDAGLRDSLDKFFLGAKLLAENPNPSGSAVMAASGGMGTLAVVSPHIGIPLNLGVGALSKLLHSSAGVRLLTQGMQAPINSARAPIVAAQILRIAGNDVMPASNVVPISPRQAAGNQDQPKQPIAENQPPPYDPLGILHQ